MIGLGVHCEL